MRQSSNRECRWLTGPTGKAFRTVSRKALPFLCATLGLIVALSAVSLSAQSSISSFAGRWDLTLANTSGSLPSWIDVSQDQGRVKVVLVGLTDHATPLAQAEIKNGNLVFVSPAGQEGFPVDTTYTLKPAGDHLAGTVTNSEHKWTLTAKRAPALKRHTTVRWGKPVPLFNGKNFAGWTFRDPSKASSWKIEGGDLVSTGRGSELISKAKFRDFKLHVEFNAGPQSNSGIYLRGRYEVQIETNSASEPPSHHTGGVYGFLDPTPEQPRASGKWQTFDITLIGRTVTVVQNGVTIIDHKEIPGITGGALDSNEGLRGPIYLQGSEEGRVAFRNIVLTPAKD
jgi:hypothetical protein